MFEKRESIKVLKFRRRLLICPVTALGLVCIPTAANAQKKVANKAHFCSQLGKTFQASSGAQMYCFGPQKNGPGVSIENEPAVSPQVQQAQDRSGSDSQRQ